MTPSAERYLLRDITCAAVAPPAWSTGEGWCTRSNPGLQCEMYQGGELFWQKVTQLIFIIIYIVAVLICFIFIYVLVIFHCVTVNIWASTLFSRSRSRFHFKNSKTQMKEIHVYFKYLHFALY